MSQTPRALRNFIAGEYRDAAADTAGDVVDPSTGQVVAQAPVSSRQDVDAAYAAASTAEASTHRRWAPIRSARRPIGICSRRATAAEIDRPRPICEPVSPTT